MATPHRTTGLAAAVLLLAGVLAGCGDNGGSQAHTRTTSSPSTAPSTTPSTSPSNSPKPDPVAGLPACERVWVAGNHLAASYRGCNDHGKAVRADSMSCSSGQSMVRYADRFYAVRGGKVTRSHAHGLFHDHTYLHRAHVCRG